MLFQQQFHRRFYVVISSGFTDVASALETDEETSRILKLVTTYKQQCRCNEVFSGYRSRQVSV
jgi:hypothetical protein